MTADASFSNPQDFDTSELDDCWSESNGLDSDATPKWDATDAFGIGMGSVYFDFWSIPGIGDTFSLTSALFTTPTVAGDKLWFDGAGDTFGTAVDSVTVEESSDGGMTWSAVVTLTNEPGGLINTVDGPQTGEMFPDPDEWQSYDFDLTPGTNRIRFVAVSDFGDNIWLDNISVGVVPSARHTPYGVGCAGVELSSATAPVEGTTVTFDVNGAPELVPTSGISAGVVIVDFVQAFPGTDLSGLGLLDADCLVYVNNLSVLLTAVGLFGGPVSTALDLPVGVPPGTILYEQAAFLRPTTPTNSLGVDVSNGLRSQINTF